MTDIQIRWILEVVDKGAGQKLLAQDRALRKSLQETDVQYTRVGRQAQVAASEQVRAAREAEAAANRQQAALASRGTSAIVQARKAGAEAGSAYARGFRGASVPEAGAGTTGGPPPAVLLRGGPRGGAPSIAARTAELRAAVPPIAATAAATTEATTAIGRYTAAQQREIGIGTRMAASADAQAGAYTRLASSTRTLARAEAERTAAPASKRLTRDVLTQIRAPAPGEAERALAERQRKLEALWTAGGMGRGFAPEARAQPIGRYTGYPVPETSPERLARRYPILYGGRQPPAPGPTYRVARTGAGYFAGESFGLQGSSAYRNVLEAARTVGGVLRTPAPIRVSPMGSEAEGIQHGRQIGLSSTLAAMGGTGKLQETLTHETAHWVDRFMLGAGHGWDNVSKQLTSRLMATPTAGRIAETQPGITRQYLLRPTELYARAFTQRFAETSKEAELAPLREHIARRQASGINPWVFGKGELEQTGAAAILDKHIAQLRAGQMVTEEFGRAATGAGKALEKEAAAASAASAAVGREAAMSREAAAVPPAQLRGKRWEEPLPPLGTAGKSRRGGYTSIAGLTNYEFGKALEESIATNLPGGLRRLHTSGEQSPFDVGRGRDVYEVKGQTREAEEYKSKLKAGEAEGKRAWAEAQGKVAHTMIGVFDQVSRTAQIYSRPGVGAFRLPTEAREPWRYHGTVPVGIGGAPASMDPAKLQAASNATRRYGDSINYTTAALAGFGPTARTATGTLRTEGEAVSHDTTLLDRYNLVQREALAIGSQIARSSNEVAGARDREAAATRRSAAAGAEQRRALGGTLAAGAAGRAGGGGAVLAGALGLARKGALGVGGAVVAAGGLTVLGLKRGGEAAGEAAGIRGLTGLPAAQALQLTLIAKAVGVNARSIGQAFGTLGKQVVKLGEGQEKGGKAATKATEAWAKLGISPAQVSGLKGNLPALFDLVYKRAGKLPEAERAGVLKTFLGRGAVTAGKITAAGPLAQQMQELGGTLGGLDPQKLEKLHIAEIKLKEATIGLELAFAQAFGPTLITLLQAVTPLLKPIGEALGAVIKAPLDWAKENWPKIKGIAKDVAHGAGSLVKEVEHVLAPGKPKPGIRGEVPAPTPGPRIFAPPAIPTRPAQLGLTPEIGVYGQAGPPTGQGAPPLLPLRKAFVPHNLLLPAGVEPEYGRAPQRAPRPVLQGAGEAIFRKPPDPTTWQRVGKVIGEVFKVLGEAGSAIGKFVAHTARELAPTMHNLGDIFGKLSPLLLPVGRVLLWITKINFAIFAFQVKATVFGLNLLTGAIRWIINNALNLKPFENFGRKIVGAFRFLTDTKPFVAFGHHVAQVASGVGHWFGGIPGTVASIWRSATGALIGQVSGWPRAVWHAISGIPGKVLDLGKGLFDKAWELGRKIPEGIVSGVGSLLSWMGNWLIKQVENLAGKIIKPFEELGSKIEELIPGARKGGKVKGTTGANLRAAGFRGGGMVPAYVSPGEQVIYGNTAWMVPGASTASDSVAAMLPIGAAVVTGHGQAMMAQGASLSDALAHQAPHFAKGGFVATAYGPPWGGIEGGGTTRTGINLSRSPHLYIVAVDPSVIPLGSLMRIKPNPFNYGGSFAAEDTGGAIKGKRLDFYDWRGRASQNAWGRRKVSVELGGKTTKGKLTATLAGTPSVPAGGTSRSITAPIIEAVSATREGLVADTAERAFTAGKEGLTWRDIAAGALGARGAERPGIIGSIAEAVGDLTTSISEKVPRGKLPAGLRLPGGAAGTTLGRMDSFAAAASSRWPNYSYGGGHGGFAGPYDCSGYVSAILHAGGFLGSPITTDGLKSWGDKGVGRFVTVGVRGSTGRAAHTMIRVGQDYWEAGGSSGKVGRVGGWDGRFPVKRHPRGFRRGGIVGGASRKAAAKALRISVGRLLPGSFDPTSSAFVGYGLRTGGLVGGGRVDFHTAARVVSGAGASLAAAIGGPGFEPALVAAGNLLSGFVGSYLERVRASLVRTEQRGGDARIVKALRSMIDLIDAQINLRIGQRVRIVETIGAQVTRREAQRERAFRRTGIDPASAAALGQTAKFDSEVVTARQQQLQEATKATREARKTGKTSIIQEANEKMLQAREDLDEAFTKRAEDTRAMFLAQAQEVTEAAAHHVSQLQAQLTQLGIGPESQAKNVLKAQLERGQIVPALQQQQASELARLGILKAQGGSLQDIRSVEQEIWQASTDIATALSEASQALEKAAHEAVEAAEHIGTEAQAGLQTLELEQRLKGTTAYETGGAARAAYIQREILPAIAAEIAAKQAEQREAEAQGDPVLARQIAEAIHGKLNDKLQAQLDAMEAIDKNTDRKIGGTLGFTYGGENLSDQLIGVGSGA